MVIPAAANQACGAGQNAAAVSLLLVGEDLGVGQPGVVVDGGVQVAVAEDRGWPCRVRPVRRRLRSCLRGLAGDAPAAAVGDVAELLDVDVDQLAGPVALVAADRHARWPGPGAPARAAVAGQDRVHGGGRPGPAGRRSGPGPAALTRRPTIRRSVRRGVRAGLDCGREDRSAMPASPELAVAGRPPRRGRGRDLEPLRGPPQRPARPRRRTGPAAAVRSRSAGHYGGPRGPPGCSVQIVVIHTEPGGPHHSRSSARVAVTNVRGQYS